MAFRSELAVGAALLLLACPLHVYADKLQFTSIPPGATVELDGVSIGTTPCEKDFPGGYFHKTKTSYGTRLEHPLVARISLPGYATKELTLTDGPQNWLSLNGRSHGSIGCSRPIISMSSYVLFRRLSPAKSSPGFPIAAREFSQSFRSKNLYARPSPQSFI